VPSAPTSGKATLKSKKAGLSQVIAAGSRPAKVEADEAFYNGAWLFDADEAPEWLQQALSSQKLNWVKKISVQQAPQGKRNSKQFQA
jgi:hypothetical protein